MKYPDDYINKVICGDCLEVMKGIPDKSVDLVLTDPPYGVGFKYSGYDDTAENLIKLIPQFMPELLRIGKRVVLTPGNSNQYSYPKPTWTMAWVVKQGTGMNPWGFTCWQPIIVYGKDPYLANKMGSRPDIIEGKNVISKKYNHPCPKPIDIWSKILLRCSVKKDDVVLDPFLGSGTTAVACKELGRKYIGIEINPKYCEISQRRLAQEYLF